ncbi:hypothetical protein QTP86_023981, partial [Hemibagrus guttatus]
VKPAEEKEGQTSNEGDKRDEEGGSREEEEEAGDEGTSKEEGAKEKACWRVGLKVAWDIHTPGLALPLQSGDCYYMTDDLNRTHQHCVLAGDTARFSSTHRVAQCITGTLEYIQKRCSEALENLHTDPETGAKSLRSLLLSTLQHIEDIHNEVEFEWLRQYWFQGRRYARFCSWWNKPMERLETDWKQMERMVGYRAIAQEDAEKHMMEKQQNATLKSTPRSMTFSASWWRGLSLSTQSQTELLLEVVEDESNVQENRQEMAETLLNALSDRQQHRQTWRDRKISARTKEKVYRTVVSPVMLYGLETVSLRKRQESELEVAELKMLRFSLGVTRLDRIRNEYIRGTAHVGRLGDKVREARLRWFGHVQRRESEYIGRRMLDMELPGRRQRGRPKRRYMDGINEDMKL